MQVSVHFVNAVGEEDTAPHAAVLADIQLLLVELSTERIDQRERVRSLVGLGHNDKGAIGLVVQQLLGLAAWRAQLPPQEWHRLPSERRKKKEKRRKKGRRRSSQLDVKSNPYFIYLIFCCWFRTGSWWSGGG